MGVGKPGGVGVRRSGVMLWACAAALLCLAAVAQAGEVNLRFRYAPDDLMLQPEGEFTRVALRGADLPEDTPGEPWLPAVYVNVVVPAGARPTDARVTASEVLVAEDLKVYPVQPPANFGGPQPEFVLPNAAVYGRQQKTPGRQAIVGDVQRLRGYSIVSVRLNPVRYLPAAGELYLSETLDLKVVYAEGAGAAAVRGPSDGKSAALVGSLVANPGDVSSFQPSSTEGTRDSTTGQDAQYLVITSTALADAFQALADRRAAQGLSAAVVTVGDIETDYEGQDTQEKIRNCVADHYADHGTQYVVLGGDNTVVPDRDCSVSVGSTTSSDMPTDLYYGALDGTWDADGDGTFGEASEDDVDLLPEVWVGRIPVRTTAQATDYINKVAAYESAAADGFSDRFLLMGVECWNTYSGDSVPADFSDHDPVSDSDIWSNRMHRQIIQPDRQPTFFGKLFDTRATWDSASIGDYAVSAANMAARINEGFHHVFMATHGGTTVWATESGGYFSSSTALNLTNADNPSLVYTIACNTGGFDSGEPSLSEAFVRNPDGGALAYMGCSRYGWGSPGSSTGGTSFRYARQFYTEVFHNGYSVLGEAFGRHKMALASSCSYNGSYRWVQFGLNLQGDPAVTIHGQESGRAVHVDVPNGLEQYHGGGAATVRWCAGGSDWSSGDEVQLEYSTDAGANWEPVPGGQGVQYDAASFDWTQLPEGGVSECRVRVSAVDTPPVADDSDGDFSIAEPLVLLTDTLPTGTSGEPYDTTLEASGGTTPYEWSVLGHESLEPQQDPAPGTAQGWNADDNCWQYDLPFAFPLGGTSYSAVYVSSNGFLDFTGSSTDWSNSTGELAERVRIAPLWDDLRTDGSAQADEDIYIHQPEPGSVAFRWLAQTYSGSHPVDVEVVLHDSGRIEFHYGAGNTGLSPTVGMSTGDGRYVLSAHDGQGTLTEAESAVFGGLPDGLSLSASTGRLSGTPQVGGLHGLRFYVGDSGGRTAYADLDLQIEGSAILNVESTPLTGVAISGDPAGTTDYSADVPGGTAVSLTAPETASDGQTEYVFSHWELDGEDQPTGSLSITFTMGSGATATAVYSSTSHTLQVQSTPIAGVAISGAPGGVTDYSTDVADGTPVALTAPTTTAVGQTDYLFERWQLNAVDQPAGQTSLSFALETDSTAVAVHSVVDRTLFVQSTPITGVDVGGTPPGRTDYEAVLPDATAVTLQAPATFSAGSVDYTFSHWILNDECQPGGQTSLSFTLSSDCQALAVYETTRHTLGVTSSPITGVPISGTHAGTTPYNASVTDGLSVRLEAPGKVIDGGMTYVLDHWTLDGQKQPAGAAELSFTMDADATTEAVYAAQEAVDALVFGVNEAGGIFRRTETTLENPGGMGWGRIPGRLMQISAGVAAVWGLNPAGGVWCRTEVSESNPSGSDWSQVPGKLAQISAGAPDVVWGVNAGGGIFYRVGITSENPTGTDWLHVSGTLMQVSVGADAVWGLSGDGRICCRAGVSPTNPTGDAWEPVPGRLAQLSAGQNGAVWGVNAAGGVFVRTGISPSAPTGTDWTRVSGSLARVAAADDAVWGVGETGSIWYRTGISPTEPLGTRWSPCPGALSQVSVGTLELPVPTEKTGNVDDVAAATPMGRNVHGPADGPAGTVGGGIRDNRAASGDSPVDANAPRLTVTGPQGTVSESLAVVSGTVEDASAVRGVWVNGIRAIATGANYATWQAVVPLSQGRTADDADATNTLVVGAADGVGAADQAGNYAETAAPVTSVGEAGLVRKVSLDTLYRGCLVAGDVDTFQFDATAGTGVDITLDGAGSLELRDPWGETVEPDSKGLTLAATGLYTLRVLPDGATGRYELSITGTVPRSVVRASAALTDPADEDAYTVASVAGGALTARAFTETPPAHIAVLDPAGRTVAQADGLLRGLFLPVTGDYTVVVSGSGGAYGLVCSVTPPQTQELRLEAAALLRVRPVQAAAGDLIELTVVGAANGVGAADSTDGNAVLIGGAVVEPEGESLRAGRGLLQARVPTDLPPGECAVSFIANGEESDAAPVQLAP